MCDQQHLGLDAPFLSARSSLESGSSASQTALQSHLYILSTHDVKTSAVMIHNPNKLVTHTIIVSIIHLSPSEGHLDPNESDQIGVFRFTGRPFSIPIRRLFLLPVSVPTALFSGTRGRVWGEHLVTWRESNV